MGDENRPEATTAQTLRVSAEAFQDAIIGKRLPGWLRNVPADHMPALSQALSKSLAYRHQLEVMLAGIKGVDAFVASALNDALSERYGAGYNVRRLMFLQGIREPVIGAQPTGSHLTQVDYQEAPLLEIALRNFTAAQARPGGQPRGNRLLITQPVPPAVPTAWEFAALCRELDLGERYQRHLDAVFKAPGVDALLNDAYRHAMLVDAYRARFDNLLADNELTLVVDMCVEGQLGWLAGDRVVPKLLELLGCRLEQIVVLDVINQGPLLNSTSQVLLYVPGDPHGAWSTFPSLRHLANELGRRLRDKPYQQFFSRFVRRRDSQNFFSIVIPAYEDLAIWANISLNERLHAYPLRLFDSLATARVRQIKDDAALIAMPVAQLDRDLQQAHDERLAAEGWALLTIAGFFVPAIGLALLTVTAWELLGEVYHGIEDWHHGQTREALDHLSNVATDLAFVAATAAGAATARRLWRRSARVDDLLPARLEDGSTKLWQQDLTRFRSQPPDSRMADAQGIVRLNGQAWIEMDGHHYSVVQRAADQQWQLRPRGGHGPELQNNGAGAWRLWSEQPTHWHDTHLMFRRLGRRFGELADEQITLVLSFHELDADHLRALHVYGRHAPACLLDSVQRCALDSRIRGLIGELRAGRVVEDFTVLEQARSLPGAAGLSDQDLAEECWRQRRLLLQRLYDATQDSDTSSTAALRRLFPSVHRLAAQEVLDGASGADRQRLLESGRIPLRMAEAARSSSRVIRLARVYEALFLDMPQNADVAKVSLSLLRHLPGARQLMRWRLFEGYSNGPLLLSTHEGEPVFDLVHLNGQFGLLDEQGRTVGESGELFEVMTRAWTPAQRSDMHLGEPFAMRLRERLAREALQRREDVGQLLNPSLRGGVFRPPQRLADSRLGYPLGGSRLSRQRHPVRSSLVMLRELFPTFSDEQAAVWFERVRRSGHQVDVVLAGLRAELVELTSSLDRWVLASAADEGADRTFVRQGLLNCWQQRQSATPYDDRQPADNFHMILYGALSGGLPEIPARVTFDHVAYLALLRMDLQSVPSSFLLAFRRLHTLDLGDNRLTQLPVYLLQMPHLRSLTLTNNQITLDRTQAVTLASCEGLEYLDLSHNPLGRPFSLHGLSRLRWLNLRDTRITRVPTGLMVRPNLYYVDLRDNRISQLPQQFYQLHVMYRRRVRLAGNPLTQLERERLRIAFIAPDTLLDDAAAVEQVNNARALWGDAVGAEQRGEFVIRWGALPQGPRSARFYRVLTQLLQSEDFRQQPRALALRVLALLQAMADDSALSDELFSVSNDEWQCQDGATWCLSNLELKVLVWKALHQTEDNSQQALLDLGRRLWRLDEVDRLAVQDIQARQGNPDESEIGLAYRLGLRDPLNLPLEVGNMNFRQVAGVDDARIELACMRILEAETQERVARSLVERGFWQAHLERTYPEDFATVDKPFHEQLEAVLDDPALNDETKRGQAQDIKNQQQSARRKLMLERTLRALETVAEDPPINVR